VSGGTDVKGIGRILLLGTYLIIPW